MEPFGKGGDDPPDGGLIQVTDFESEGGAPRNHIDTARFELHKAHVRDRIAIDRLHQLVESRGGAGRGPAGVVAKAKGRGARVVLFADQLDPLAMDADDAGHQGEVDARRLHSRPLLDVQLQEAGDRGEVLMRVDQAVDLATGGGEHLVDGNASPIVGLAEFRGIELAGEGEATDQSAGEPDPFLVRKSDHLDQGRDWIF